MAEKWVVLEHPEIPDSRQVTPASAVAMKAKKGWVIVEDDTEEPETVLSRAEAFELAAADSYEDVLEDLEDE